MSDPTPAASAAPPAGAAPTVFRPSAAGPALALGRCALGTAFLALLFVLAALTASRWLRVLFLVLLVAGVVVTAAVGARLLLRVSGRGPRLVLDADGFTNTTGRPPRRVGWLDVVRLSAVTEGGRELLVAELTDGRNAAVLLRRLGVSGPVVEEAVRERLNTANGYRRFT